MDNQVPFIKTSNNSGKGFLIFLIIVLLLCCLGLGGYIVYSKFFVKEETVVMEGTTKALKQVQIDGTSLLEVEDAINNLEYAYNDSFSDYFGYIYKNNKLEATKFDKGAALFACLYPDLEESSNITYVANNTVKTRFKNKILKSIKKLRLNFYGKYEYLSDYDNYIKYEIEKSILKTTPDIIVITGHALYNQQGLKNIEHYTNTKYYMETVKVIRKRILASFNISLISLLRSMTHTSFTKCNRHCHFLD